VIPLYDFAPTRRPPVVTRLLLLANVAVWIYMLTLTPAALQAFYDKWSFDPASLRNAAAGGRVTLDAIATLFTHQFIHGGWLHIIGNMLYLWIFGDNVEDRMGSGPFLVFYLFCGLVAALGQMLIAPAPMVGASGAIAGVLGAYFIQSPGARVRTLVFLGIFITVVTLPAILVIGEWIVLQVLSGIESTRLAAHPATENVAYFAHVFGFATGALVALAGIGRR
jgi:rhomboid family protein